MLEITPFISACLAHVGGLMHKTLCVPRGTAKNDLGLIETSTWPVYQACSKSSRLHSSLSSLCYDFPDKQLEEVKCVSYSVHQPHVMNMP